MESFELQDWTKESLKEDKIPEESIFFEYIGRFLELDSFMKELLLKFKSNPAFADSISEISKLSGDIYSIRYKYLSNNLIQNDSVIQSLTKMIKESSIYDVHTKSMMEELNELINSQHIEGVKTISPIIKDKLERIKKIDTYIYEKSTGLTLTAKEEKNVDAHPSDKKAHPSDKKIVYDDLPPVAHIIKRYQPEIQERLQASIPISKQMYSKKSFGELLYLCLKRLTINYGRSLKKNIRYTANNIKQKFKNISKPLSKKAIVLLITTVIAAALIANGLNVKATTDIPKNPSEIQLNDKTYKIPDTSQDTLSLSTNNTTPQHETSTTQNYQVNPTIKKEETAPQKNTLSYTVQFMDDEMISLVANSLRSSINGMNESELRRYGNGCNKEYASDREYVTAVFKELDANVSKLSTSSFSFDSSIMLPQITQLLEDLTKDIIARTINASGQYGDRKYTKDNIDLYTRRTSEYAPDVNAVTVRILSDDGSKVLYKIGDLNSSCNHFTKAFAPNLYTLGTLKNYRNDAPLGHASDNVAYQTRHGYTAICNILDFERNMYYDYDSNGNLITMFKCNAPGKGMKAVSLDQDHSR